ncbi:MAG: AAA family ATPase [Planctomycetota bacterium]|nr:AAA family ATPase [Planctomycetota bacterium]
MFRMESGVVLKYFPPMDSFIKIRVFTEEEVSKLLTQAHISDKRSYYGLILNASLLHYNDQILPKIPRDDPSIDPFAVEETLYKLCIEVNPSLDINKVTIPAPESTGGEIHLLEGPKGEPQTLQGLERFQNMESDLNEHVIGQSEAVAHVTHAIKKSMTGMRDPKRPVATFLFVGQTGVGKTELAKALSTYMFQDLNRMIRVDCSEFALPHEYAKLIGSPPGYVGHDQGGLLAEAARLKGETVVLFDEVEKSDTKVHDLLLQMMDEGFVTDNKGQRIPFNDAVIILTSNVGTSEVEKLRNRIGFDNQTRRSMTRDVILDETLSSLHDRFRPEFLNRIGEIILFNEIGVLECEKIIRIFLGEVTKHAATIPFTVHFTQHVPRFLAERGYKPEFGARELRRTVEREVESPLSDLLIDGRIKEGDIVEVRVQKDRLKFHQN